MLRNIFLTLMVALFPFALKAQGDTTKVASHEVRGYQLSISNPARLDDMAKQVLGLIGPSTIVKIDGHTDGTGFRHCKGDSLCNVESNASLRVRRAEGYRDSLVARGVPTGKIFLGLGTAAQVRGGEYRGVTIHILEIAPTVAQLPKNDSLANVARAVDTLKTDMKSVKAKVEKLDTAVTQVTAVVQQMIDNSSADTGKDKEVRNNESWIDLGLGLGFNSAYAGGTKESSLNMGGGIFMKPRVLPFELLLRGGYWPKGQSKEWKCTQADATLSLGAHKVLYNAETFMVGASVGGFTDRRYCSNGGVKLAEQWTEKVDGIYAGPSFQVPMFGGLHLWATAEVTYGHVATAENLYKPKSAFGMRTSALLRWAPKKNNEQR